jgi:hypothetical protein
MFRRPWDLRPHGETQYITEPQGILFDIVKVALVSHPGYVSEKKGINQTQHSHMN